MNTAELLHVVNDSDSESDFEEVIEKSGGRDNNGEYYWKKKDCLWVKTYYPHATLDTDSHGVKRKNSIEENTHYSIKKKKMHKRRKLNMIMIQKIRFQKVGQKINQCVAKLLDHMFLQILIYK